MILIGRFSSDLAAEPTSHWLSPIYPALSHSLLLMLVLILSVVLWHLCSDWPCYISFSLCLGCHTTCYRAVCRNSSDRPTYNCQSTRLVSYHSDCLRMRWPDSNCLQLNAGLSSSHAELCSDELNRSYGFDMTVRHHRSYGGSNCVFQSSYLHVMHRLG